MRCLRWFKASYNAKYWQASVTWRPKSSIALLYWGNAVNSLLLTCGNCDPVRGGVNVSFCRLQFLSFPVTVYTTETKAAETPKCGWLNNTPSPINTWRYSSNLAIKIALPLILFPMTYELATHFSRSAKQEGEMSEPNSLRYEQGIENNLMECRSLYAGTFADVTL